MKIIALNGSPNSTGSTAKLINFLLDECRRYGADCEKIDLADYEIEGCRVCNRCIDVGECVREDDFIHLKAKMYEADGIVIGSPYYNGGPTDILTAFFIRFSKSGSVQKILREKYFIGVATSGSDNCSQLAEFCANLGDPGLENKLKVSAIISLATSGTNNTIEIANNIKLKSLVTRTCKSFIKDIKRRHGRFYIKVRNFIFLLYKKTT